MSAFPLFVYVKPYGISYINVALFQLFKRLLQGLCNSSIFTLCEHTKFLKCFYPAWLSLKLELNVWLLFQYILLLYLGGPAELCFVLFPILIWMMTMYLNKQGLKRLKKYLSEGRCGGHVMSSESRRVKESNRSSYPISDHKEALESSLKDRFARGSGIPISIKYKKLGHKEAGNRQKEHRKDRIQQDLGRTIRQPPPLEIGPKRLKVRGPAYVESESRWG